MEEQIINVFSEISGKSKEVLNKETVVRETGINSLTIIKMIAKIEEILDIEISDEDLDFSKIITIKDLIDIIKRNYNKCIK